MSRMIFVNLPVQDLDKSVAFFTELGFDFNAAFTDENATCMVVSDQAFVMLLVRPFFATFTRKEVADASVTETTVGLSAGSREEVDALVDRALALGAAPRSPRRRTRGTCTAAASTTSTATCGTSSGWTPPPRADRCSEFSSAQHSRSTGGTSRRHSGARRSGRRLSRIARAARGGTEPCCGECAPRSPTGRGPWPPWPATAGSGRSTSWACRSSRASRGSPTSWCSPRPRAGRSPRWPRSWSRPAAPPCRWVPAPSRPWSTARPATSTPYGAWSTAPTASPTRWRGCSTPRASATCPRPRRCSPRCRTRSRCSLAGRRIEVRRTTPFTATEHARATAFAEAGRRPARARARRHRTCRGRGGPGPRPLPAPARCSCGPRRTPTPRR